MHIVSLRAKPLDRASWYILRVYPKDRTHEGILLSSYLLYLLIQTIERTMFSQTFFIHNKMTPCEPMGPYYAPDFKKNENEFV